MSKNSFGHLFCVTSFGESHGHALGVIIDGCPAGVPFNKNFLDKCMIRRRPGDFGKKGDGVVSARKEADEVEVLSGVFENKTLGTPIAMMVRNKDQRSSDYNEIKNKSRAGHADDTWRAKYGHVDHRGGGRSSGRETLCRVMAGAVAQMYLKTVCEKFKIYAYASEIGSIKMKPDQKIEANKIDDYIARFPDKEQESDIEKLLLDAKKEGKSYGGVARLIIEGVPVGLGQPVFHKLKADLSSALMGIGATCAVGLGDGVDLSKMEGSSFHSNENSGYGGIRGGISTGEPIIMEVFFKPTSSVMDIAKKGRHDPCIVPRAIPVIEAMASITLADHFLWALGDRI